MAYPGRSDPGRSENCERHIRAIAEIVSVISRLSRPGQKFYAPYAPVAFALALRFKVPLPVPRAPFRDRFAARLSAAGQRDRGPAVGPYGEGGNIILPIG